MAGFKARDITDLLTRAKGRVQQNITWRNREQVARFFTGMELVAPGLVPVDEWRPAPGRDAIGYWSMWCAVGRKN